MGFVYFAQMSHENNQQMDIQPNDMHKEEKRTLQYNHWKETNVRSMFRIFNDILVMLTAKLSISLSTFT